MKSSSTYRRYSSSIPSFLQDRPCDMVNHCLEKISLVNMDECRALENGAFNVNSFSVGSTQSYQVNFGNGNLMPGCTCEGWCATAYLCKHFFQFLKLSLLVMACFVTSLLRFTISAIRQCSS